MDNPARELVRVLELWRVTPAKATVRSHRGLGRHDAASDQWFEQARVFGLLIEVEKFIAALESAGRDVAHFRRALPAWTIGLLAPDISWQATQQNDVSTVSIPSVDVLRSLADLIDMSRLSVSLDPEVKGSSVDALDEVTELLSQADLAPAAKQYVFELITSCRRVFAESSALGSVDLLARVHELIGALHMLADGLDNDPAMKLLAKKLRSAAKRVAPYVSFGVKATAGTVGFAANLLQITS